MSIAIQNNVNPEVSAPLDARTTGTSAVDSRPQGIYLYDGLLRYETDTKKLMLYDAQRRTDGGIADPGWVEAVSSSGVNWPEYWYASDGKLKILAFLSGGFIGTSELTNGVNGVGGDVVGTMATETMYTRNILPYVNDNLAIHGDNNANTHKTKLSLGSDIQPVTELHIGPTPQSDLQNPQDGSYITGNSGPIQPVCSIKANLTMGEIATNTVGQITTGSPNNNLTLMTGTDAHTTRTGHVQIGTGSLGNSEPNLVVHGDATFNRSLNISGSITGTNNLKIIGGGFIGTSELENGPSGTYGDVAGAMATRTVRTREILPYKNTNTGGGTDQNAHDNQTTLHLGSATTPVTELHIGASPLSDLQNEQGAYINQNDGVTNPVCNINANLTMGQIMITANPSDFIHNPIGQITTGDPSHNLTLTTAKSLASHPGHVQIGTGLVGTDVEPKLVVNGDMIVSGTVEDTLKTTNLTVAGDATFNGGVNISGKSRVYFSVQLGSNAHSRQITPNDWGDRAYNYLNELQSSVPSNTRGLAGFSDTWNISSIVSSDDQSNFATNGYVVPRTGVYKIDCYQTIKSTSSNSSNAGLRVYRNPTASIWTSQNYQDSTCLAVTNESEYNPYPNFNARRSESLVWLGQLNQGDAIKFMITCDNGFGPNGSMYKSCYTIVSVDDDPVYFKSVVGESLAFKATATTSTLQAISDGNPGKLVSSFLTDTSGFRGQFNDGNAFSTSTGLFTAPTNGLYYFKGSILWHTYSFAEGYLATMISTPEKITNADAFLVTQHGSNQVYSVNFTQDVSGVLKLTAGDQIGLYGWSLNADPRIQVNYSQFSGHRISSTVTASTKHHGSMTFMPGTIQSTRSTTKPVAHGQLGGQHYYGSGSSLGAHYEFIAVDTEIEPVWGMTAKYTPVGVTIHTDQMVDTNGNNVTFEGSHPSRFRIARSGHYRLTVNVLMKDNTGVDKKNLFMFRRSGSNTANGYRVGTTSDLIGLARQAGSHVEADAVIFNDICELNQGDEVYPCVQMNSAVGYDKIFIDMTTYFNIQEI